MPAKKNTRGPSPGTGGRPSLGRVRLSTKVLPDVRDALGDAPGLEIERLVIAEKKRRKKKP